uniref:Immunoglobulin V-set domain-containing protein n=1 Tax=Acanthochromis polyacanthus TaxID=80966 RepID=A0A3Q1HTZ4_9TELE
MFYCVFLLSVLIFFSRSIVSISVVLLLSFDHVFALLTGENFTYWCSYKDIGSDVFYAKFICKGEDPSECKVVATTKEPHLNPRFSMFDDKAENNITINITEVTTNDTGTYWCGVQKFDPEDKVQFVQKFFMNDGFQFICAVISFVAVLLLMLLLFVALLIFIYKRKNIYYLRICIARTHTDMLQLHTKPRSRTSLSCTGYNNIYEEIQERVQIPDSENALNTIYVTANLPADPTPSLHYSTIHFQSSPDRAGREALIPKPSSSACQYSTVKYSRSSTDSAVSQPSGPTGEPLYSTVNKLRKQ